MLKNPEKSVLSQVDVEILSSMACKVLKMTKRQGSIEVVMNKNDEILCILLCGQAAKNLKVIDDNSFDDLTDNL